MTIEELVESLKAIPALAVEVERLRNEIHSLRQESKPSKDTSRRKFLSIKEVAEELNISTTSVRRLVERDLLKRSHGMRMIRIPVEEIENYKLRTVLK
jgi:orotate phosphoribosyltransferase-like protein